MVDYQIAFLLLELTFMFNSEYIERIVHTYQYERIIVIAQLSSKMLHTLTIHVCDDCAIAMYLPYSTK